VIIMQATQALVLFAKEQHLQHCPLPATAPFEIHGGRDRGCLPGDDYLFQGHRYLYDIQRDVLVREDVRTWIASQQ
jgi:hypothetical protein